MSLARGLHPHLSLALIQSAPLPVTGVRYLCPLPFRLHIQEQYNTMVKLKKIDAFFKRKTLDKENGCSFQYFGKDLPPLKVIKVMKPMIKKMTIINHIIGWLRRRLLSWSLDWGNWDELFKIIMCLFLCQVSLGLVLRGVLWTLIRE
ncbi:hypothetical protein MtrunA17_Chr7g0269481 [Medicago truncatula]|uniref:Uncharacterized protein n=1 Tax=Medicago truncatula TaxID=3880 RepID=A0A072U3Y7_MEDTR|nr:uncharacterized protein LOC120576814 [Medicago truncatula]KEH24397.1 hypothetical protein MTR_7g108835 [Medicago truncatula]RHN48969.1 hypothetical protein MtrunA17_Chr7g0269481 [Medicago truncatula]